MAQFSSGIFCNHVCINKNFHLRETKHFACNNGFIYFYTLNAFKVHSLCQTHCTICYGVICAGAALSRELIGRGLIP